MKIHELMQEIGYYGIYISYRYRNSRAMGNNLHKEALAYGLCPFGFVAVYLKGDGYLQAVKFLNGKVEVITRGDVLGCLQSNLWGKKHINPEIDKYKEGHAQRDYTRPLLGTLILEKQPTHGYYDDKDKDTRNEYTFYFYKLKSGKIRIEFNQPKWNYPEHRIFVNRIDFVKNYLLANKAKIIKQDIPDEIIQRLKKEAFLQAV